MKHCFVQFKVVSDPRNILASLPIDIIGIVQAYLFVHFAPSNLDCFDRPDSFSQLSVLGSYTLHALHRELSVVLLGQLLDFGQIVGQV